MAKKPLLTQREVIDISKADMRKRKMTHTQYAAYLGISKQYLRNVHNGFTLPNERIGYRKVILYVRIGK